MRFNSAPTVKLLLYINKFLSKMSEPRHYFVWVKLKHTFCKPLSNYSNQLSVLCCPFILYTCDIYFSQKVVCAVGSRLAFYVSSTRPLMGFGNNHLSSEFAIMFDFEEYA